MSFAKTTLQLTLASNDPSNPQPASDFTAIQTQPLNLEQGVWVVGLTQLSVWFTNYNISAAFGNNQITFFNPLPASLDPAGEIQVCTFPDGIYQGQQIIDYFSNFCFTNSADITDPPSIYPYLFFSIVEEQLRFQVNISDVYAYSVDFTAPNSPLTILGFDPAVYSTTTLGQNQADITNGISSYLVHCSAVNGNFSFVNGRASDVIYSYTPTLPPGSVLSYIPTFPVFLQCNSSMLQTIRVYITDQLGRPVNLNSGPSNSNNPTGLTLAFIRRDD